LLIRVSMSSTISGFMTPTPHTIGQDQHLALAHRLMREQSIRHLPVLQGGQLVGLLSQRDLYFIETLRDVDPERVAVSEAMSQEVYTVEPGSAVTDVVKEMIAHKYGAAVVVDRGEVVGVFTTIDALQALSELLERRGVD
jgi:acetoin utilization protein AcuB